MNDLNLYTTLPVSMVASALAIGLLRHLARPLKLLDHPNERKQHAGAVPLVGGLAMFAAMLAAILWPGETLDPFTRNLFGSAGVLVLLGVLDDRHDLSVRLRVVAQVLASLWIVVSTGVYVHSLGAWFGVEITMPSVIGIPFTVIAVIGLLNAFNMIDGINGLAGSTALVTILSLALLGGPGSALMPLVVMAAALVPYLLCNLGLFGARSRIFLGDAGSTLIGYILAWSLIRASQDVSHAVVTPTDVLWCVALPVFDTLAIMIRRGLSGKSPFKPDRGHVHHLLMFAGIGPRTTLVILIGSALSLFALGAFLSVWLPAGSGVVFVALLLAYTAFSTWVYRRQHDQRVQAKLLRKLQRAPTETAVVTEGDADMSSGLSQSGM
jgi:UDP-GlcNAc:undecaprenyl-phosphate/decaprenyl-phosphate GlcNAc-1-phosphate transferase